MVLEDYLHISLLRRHTPLPLFKLQIHLVQDLVLAEKAIADYKQKREERCAKISEGAPDKEKLEGEVRSIDRELHFWEAECRAIRDIADGIAWRLFDYDRAILCELANRPASKHISLEGIEAELHEFGQVFNSREGIAVLNDLTHFLKLGDVTIRKDTGTFELVEVKRGHRTSGRIRRQKQDMRRTAAFLNTGEREGEEGRIVISDLGVKPETFHPNIRRIITNAEEKGAAIERIGEHLIVECTDFTRAADIGVERMRAILDPAGGWVEDWAQKGELVMDFLSQDKYLDVRNYSPFSIFPFPELVRVKLMTGGLFLIAYLNISAVVRYFEQRGWKVVKKPEEHMEEIEKRGAVKDIGLATLRKGPLTTEIPWPWFGRLGFEFLRPRTLVDALEAILAAGEPEAPMSFVNLSGEAEIWD